MKFTPKKYDEKSKIYNCDTFTLLKKSNRSGSFWDYFYNSAGFQDYLYNDIKFVVEDDNIKFFINNKMFTINLNKAKIVIYFYQTANTFVKDRKFKIQGISIEFKQNSRKLLLHLKGHFPLNLILLLMSYPKVDIESLEPDFVKKEFHDFLNTERVRTLSQKLPKDMLKTIIKYM